jgi:hypothetical protein
VKCERCGVESKGYDLHDYCALCSKNLCEACLDAAYCLSSDTRTHKPAFHGMPTMACPKCGVEMADFDGVGVLAHVAPMPKPCGYCSHPSLDGDGKGNMVCGICKAVNP